MTSEGISDQLEQIALTEHFAEHSVDLVQAWESAGVGIEATEPILLFMEKHPDLEFGSPGELVHFVERFDGTEYRDKLINSVERRPTEHTAWMLNRVINGTKAPEEYQRYVAVMKAARQNPNSDENARRAIDRFLARLEPQP